MQSVLGKGRGDAVSNDREHGSDKPANQPEDSSDNKQREAVGRFARYKAPTMLALLVGDKMAAAVTNVSDIRLKRDIASVGRLPNGLNLYRYRYLWSNTPYVGVMAQEVASVDRDAVVRGADGYLRVNYARLGLRLRTWDEWVAAA
jgi:Chaperone of endosialidase